MNSHLASSFTLKENNIPPFLIVQTPQKRAVGTHFDSSRVSDSPSSSTPFPNFVFYFFHLFPSPPSSHYLHALQLQFISTFQIWVGVHLLFHSLLFFSLTLCLCISFPRSLSLSLFPPKSLSTVSRITLVIHQTVFHLSPLGTFSAFQPFIQSSSFSPPPSPPTPKLNLLSSFSLPFSPRFPLSLLPLHHLLLPPFLYFYVLHYFL